MRRFSILGISLVDLTAREGLRLADRYMKNGALNTITYITAQTLAAAAKDEEEKEYLEETDITFCVETDILEAAGIANSGRIHEIEERIFLKEFLKRLARSQVGVFLLGETQQQAQELKEMLLEQQGNLNVVDCRGFDEFDMQQERLMNAINGAAPGIVFSRMAWPMDLKLMHTGKKFLNAELWMALPDKKFPKSGHVTVFKNIQRKIFQKKVNDYNNEEEKAEP